MRHAHKSHHHELLQSEFRIYLPIASHQVHSAFKFRAWRRIKMVVVPQEESEKRLCLQVGLIKCGQRVYTFLFHSHLPYNIDDCTIQHRTAHFCNLAKEHPENCVGNKLPTLRTTDTFLVFKWSHV
ncbi:hypothetical protein P692DRAFT_20602782 [Suillus brevipes Sb2]|nr:hypothetical protein P692DRAFT_20602782 [Suillus brevipes Sb2]